MESRPSSANPLAPTSRGPRGIRLERSPFEPAVMVRGVIAGLALAAIFVAIGVPLAAATPIDADLSGLARVDVTDVDGMVVVARFLDSIGHLATVLSVALVVAVGGRWRWGTWDLGLLLFVTVAGSHAVTAVVKLLTDRSRPGAALVDTFDSAFPSGHAMRAAAVYGLVAWLSLRVGRRPVRYAVAAVAVLAIVAGASARVALAAHWPTDVVAGVIVGMVWLVLSLQLVRPRIGRPAAPGARSAEGGGSEEPGSKGGHTDQRRRH